MGLNWQAGATAQCDYCLKGKDRHSQDFHVMPRVSVEQLRYATREWKGHSEDI